MYDAVVFDMDGVLVEPTSYDAARRAIDRAFDEFGVEATEEDFDAMFDVDQDTVEELCRRHGLDTREFWRVRETEINEAQTREFEDGGKNPYPDVDVVHRLDGHRLAVVSNNQQPTVEHVVEGLGFRSRFEDVRARGPKVEDLQRKKPSPHLLKQTLDTIDAASALYVGDREKDIVAASRAGVHSALVRRSHNSDLEPEKQPTYDLEGLEDLLDVVG